MMDECPHDSLSGDEGPVALLGRMPVRWRCDECDAIIYDDVSDAERKCEHGYGIKQGPCPTCDRPTP